jgi:hypothetical protein
MTKKEPGTCEIRTHAFMRRLQLECSALDRSANVPDVRCGRFTYMGSKIISRDISNTK